KASNRFGFEGKTVMLQEKSRRGRPKGTGIDDSDRIARLAEVIRVRPELKPTTAIRAMGISDPSAIRRLRDKYHAFLRCTPADTAAPRPASTPLAIPADLSEPTLLSRH
ncbi:MAG: hypothetical protein ABL897_00330, partial [Hyphomicrobium sp.]